MNSHTTDARSARPVTIARVLQATLAVIPLAAVAYLVMPGADRLLDARDATGFAPQLPAQDTAAPLAAVPEHSFESADPYAPTRYTCTYRDTEWEVAFERFDGNVDAAIDELNKRQQQGALPPIDITDDASGIARSLAPASPEPAGMLGADAETRIFTGLAAPGVVIGMAFARTEGSMIMTMRSPRAIDLEAMLRPIDADELADEIALILPLPEWARPVDKIANETDNLRVTNYFVQNARGASETADHFVRAAGAAARNQTISAGGTVLQRFVIDGTEVSLFHHAKAADPGRSDSIIKIRSTKQRAAAIN